MAGRGGQLHAVCADGAGDVHAGELKLSVGSGIDRSCSTNQIAPIQTESTHCTRYTTGAVSLSANHVASYKALPECPTMSLNSVSGRLVALNPSKSRVYLLRDRDPVGRSEIRTAWISIWTVLIGRTDFDTTTSIPDPTLTD